MSSIAGAAAAAAGAVTDFLWGPAVCCVFVLVGVYLSVGTGFFHSRAHGIGKRARLTIRGTRSDHNAFELVGERFGIENLDVLGFNVFKRLDNGLGKFFEIHSTISSCCVNNASRGPLLRTMRF